MTKLVNKAYHEPAVDWTKEDLLLYTLSGVTHSPVEGTPSPNHRIINQGYSQFAYSLENCGDYLSVRVYDTDYGVFNRVGSYKSCIAKGQPPRFKNLQRRRITALPCDCKWSHKYEFDTVWELRVYKDRTYAILCHVQLGKRRYSYVAAPANKPAEKLVTYAQLTKTAEYCDAHPDEVAKAVHSILDTTANYTAVYTDEEVAAHAKRMTKDSVSGINNWFFFSYAASLESRSIESDLSACKCSWLRFLPAQRTMVEAFFETDSRDNAAIARQYEKKTGSRTYIGTLKEMLTWCSVSVGAGRITASKSDTIEKLLEPVREIWNRAPKEEVVEESPEKTVTKVTYDDTAYWYRTEDYICMIIPNRNKRLATSGYKHWCSTMHAGAKIFFGYNIKTKKRLYGEYYDGSSEWETPIPALNTLTDRIYLGEYTECSSDGSSITGKYKMKTEILGGLSVRELFDGTNIAWILDNDTDDNRMMVYERDKQFSNTNFSKISCVPVATSGDKSYRDFAPVNVCDSFKDDHIGSIAISILATSGMPLVEQILKSKLFNLYFYLLNDMETRDGHSPHEIFDLDMKGADHRTYEASNACMVYHSKGKNLKEMFGYGMRTMRAIDRAVAITEYIVEGTMHKWNRRLPYVQDLATLFGDLNTIDDTVLSEILTLCARNQYTFRGWNSRTAFERRAETLVSWLGTRYSPKQKLEICKKYCVVLNPETGLTEDFTDTYIDYLRMRGELKKVQEKNPDKPGIFSEAKYPIKPSASRRFIAFVDGMLSPSEIGRPRYRWSSPTQIQRDQLHRSYAAEYPRVAERHDIFDIYGDGGKLVGLTMLLDPNDHVAYLHNEVAFWTRMYADSSKDADFIKAVDRVREYEWSDYETGLQIVAPKNIADLCNEGAVLDHCVASYVDPIINGGEDIMFLRRTDMPDEPFFTVEILKDKTIGQVHCYYNEELSEEGQQRAYAMSGLPVYEKTHDVFGFLRKWCRYKKLNEMSVIEQYADVH